MLMPSEAKTASKVVVNLASRSRIRKAECADLITEVCQQVAGGLGGPGRVRVSGHAEEVHPAGADLHDEQNVKAAQRDGVQGEEVGGQQPGSLHAQEGPPPGVTTPRCRTKPSGGQDPSDGACADAVAESDEFALDPAVAPGGVLPCQAQHQAPDFVGDRRPA